MGRFWCKGWCSLSATEVANALEKFVSQTFACLGDACFECSGVPIGAGPSSVCLDIALDHYERRTLASCAVGSGKFAFITPDTWPAILVWKRFADDTFMASCSVCRPCLDEFLQSAYPMSLSVTQGDCHYLADTQFIKSGAGLVTYIKNANRPFLTEGSPRKNFSVVSWPGALPCSFATLRARIIACLSRSNAVGSSVYLCVARATELVWEYLLLGWPIPLLKKAVYSLPASVAALTLRGVIRALVNQRAFGEITNDGVERLEAGWPICC